MYKLLLIPLLTGCTMQAGISMHTERYDEPEVRGMDNPIGIVRATRAYTPNITGFCEHLSSIPAYEDGYGFNHCGYLYEF